MTLTQEITHPSNDDIDAQIGRRVHQLIWDRRTTQVALGDRIQMDASSIAKRLRGKLGWNATQLIATAEALNTTVAYLVGEDPRPDRPLGPVGPAGIEPTASTVESGRLTDLEEYRRARKAS